MCYLKGTKDACSILAWEDDVNHSLAGLGIVNPTPMYVLYTQCLRRVAKSTFEMGVCTLTNTTHRANYNAVAENVAHTQVHAHQDLHYYTLAIICEALQHMITMLMPEHILQHTKRYLHCKCCKPTNMKVCMFYNHSSNMVLNKLHCLPPFGNNQLLAMDEVVDILLFATPNSWQVKMEGQNWDPMVHTPTEVIDFMECLESAKAMDCRSTIMTNSKDKKKSAKKKNGNNNNSNNNGGFDDNPYYCKVHGHNNSHNTKQCHKVKKLKAKGKPIKPQKCGYNKSWSCKLEEAKKTSKEELGALVKEQVAKEMFLYISQQSKKCSSDSDDDELHTIEDLSTFNYKNMAIINDKVSV
jgi:hypothetical protein